MFKDGTGVSFAFSQSWLPWTAANIFQIFGKQHRVVASTFCRKVTSKVNHCHRQNHVTGNSSEIVDEFFPSLVWFYTKASLCFLLELRFSPVQDGRDIIPWKEGCLWNKKRVSLPSFTGCHFQWGAESTDRKGTLLSCPRKAATRLLNREKRCYWHPFSH